MLRHLDDRHAVNSSYFLSLVVTLALIASPAAAPPECTFLFISAAGSSELGVYARGYSSKLLAG
jgi:hypothetical protein